MSIVINEMKKKLFENREAFFFSVLQKNKFANFSWARWTGRLTLIFFIVFSFVATAQQPSPAVDPQDTVTIYMERPGGSNAEFYISQSINQLLGKLGHREWEVLTYNRPELIKAILANPPDFIFTNSDLAAVLQRYLHYTHLLSFKNRVSSDAAKLSGSLIVVKKDSEIKNLEALRGLKIGRLTAATMAGWKTAVGEVTALGYATNDFFRRVQSFSDGNAMLKALIDGDIKAAILRGCQYERLPESLREQFRPLEPRNFSGAQCLSTSELYPAWSLLASPKVPPSLGKSVADTLEDNRSLTEFGVWTAPSSLRDVYALLKRSNDDLIDTFEPESWSKILWKVRYPALILIFVLLGLFIHDRLVSKAVARQTKIVEESLKKQWSMERKVEAWERASIVSTMSSMVAHEIKQPLTVIENYSQSLLSRLSKQNSEISSETLKFTLLKIEQSVSKAIGIIEHVRSYSKNKPLDRKPMDLSALMSKILSDFSLNHPKVKIKKEIEPGLTIEGDEFELSICFINILKNAVQAMEDQTSPEICVKAEQTEEGKAVVVKIADNGKGLTEAQIENLRHPLQTSKVQGLGLGLSIIKAIAERHRGSIRMEKVNPRGLCIIIKICRNCKKV